MKRYNSIDILRAIAIILMIYTHFVIYTVSSEEYTSFFYFSDYIIGSIPAPIFAFILGMSLFVLSNRMILQGFSEGLILRTVLIRGVVIFIVGIIYSIVIWGPIYVFEWDVLTMLGFSTIVLSFIRTLPLTVISIVILAIVLLSPIARSTLGYPIFWENEIPPLTVKDITGEFFFNGYFAIFPWISFATVGYAIGKLVLSKDNIEVAKRNSINVLILGILISSLGVLGYVMNNTLKPEKPISLFLSELSFHPLSTTSLLILIGLCMVSFSMLYLLMDTKNAEYSWMPVFRIYSKYSLTLFVLHQVPIVLIPRIIGAIFFGDEYHFYENLFTPAVAVVLSVVFTIILYPILILWERINGKYSLEWIIRKIYQPKPTQNT